MRPHRWLLALGLLSASAIAQQRSPFFATVRGPDGKPLAGAEVTCVFTPSLLVPGVADVVRCTTDAQGRARGDLRHGLLYVAWATGPVDDKAVCFVSEPVQLVAAGRVVDLSAWARQPGRRFALPTAAAWQPAGATAMRWFPVAGQEAFVDIPLPADGEIPLPPSPWATGCLALVDAAGELLVTAAMAAGATNAPVFVEPVKFDVTVSDDGGKPVGGAVLEHYVAMRAGEQGLFGWSSGIFGWTGSLQTRLRRAAVTRPDGTASFFAPRSNEPLLVRATRPGFGWVYESFTAGDAAKALTLPSANATQMRITGAGEAKLTLGAQAAYQLRLGNGMTFGQHPVAIEPQDATTWLLHAPAAGFTPRLGMQRDGIPIGAVLDWIEKPAAELRIDLQKHQRVEVRVLGPDGGPPGCALAVARQGDGHPVYWDQILAADTAGRATLLLPAGPFFVYATNGSAHALALVDAAATEPLALKLEPLPTMRLTVLTADGRPVAGAHAAMQRLRGGHGGPSALAQQRYRVAFHLWASYVASPSSGPDGRLDLPLFLPDGMKAQILVSTPTQQSERFDVIEGAERTVTVK